MHTNNLFLHPPPPSIAAVFLIFILFPTSFSTDDEQYTECRRSYICGAVKNITYPFWGFGRPSFCGRQGFELRCQNNESLVLTTDEQDFRVVKLDPMTIARTDLWENHCKPEIHNTSLNYTLFEYAATGRSITLFYNCSKFPGEPFVNASNSFDCVNDGVKSVGFYADDRVLSANFPANHSLPECGADVRVPVLQVALDKVGRELSLDEALKEGFEVNYEADLSLCSACVLSGGICGSNQTDLSQFACLCRSHPYPSVCPKNGERKWRWNSIAIAAAIGVGILLLCIVCLCFRRKLSSSTSMEFWKKRSKNDQNLEDFIRNHGSLALKRYTYSSIKKITNSYRDKLGQGGYGGVYKGKLPDGKLVAVKVLNASKGNGEEFINEVASISRTSHVNIVTLLGFCLEPHKRAVIYEFMPNGSLEKFIFKDNSLEPGSHLGWEKLYQIVIGIARGLEYLHRGCNMRILHFDIKPHNILLDEDFCPKISDFGMAKLCPGKESIVSMSAARGTIGYIAPEVLSRNFGEVSHKSDVYSYGMMVLEMVGAREKINVGASDSSEMYFPEMVYKHLDVREEMGLQGLLSKEEGDVVRKMILVGLWCVQIIPSNRPSMRKVIEMLEGSLEALQIPPKPLHSPPTRLPQEISATSSSTLL